jgi:hypothetical protein
VNSPRRHGEARLARADVALYGLAAAISVSGLLLQLLSSGARAKGIGVIVVVLGLFLGLTRLLLQRISAVSSESSARLDGFETSLRLADSPTVGDNDLSPVAARLWAEAVEAHSKTHDAIANGSMVVSGAATTIWYLRLLTEEASHTMHAVDHVDPAHWLTDPHLTEYLTFQLARVRDEGVALERIRIVSTGDLESRDNRDALTALIKLHESAGAKMLLCPEAGARELGTDFFPAKGALIIDRDGKAACLTGRLGPQGFIENGTVYLKLVGPGRTTVDDYQRIAERIAVEGWDAALRLQLVDRAEPLSAGY